MILDLFNDDIIHNIFILFTFSDASKPFGFKAINEFGIKYANYFQISCGCYTRLSGASNAFGKDFFDLTTKAFESIFETLSKVKKKSIKKANSDSDAIDDYIVNNALVLIICISSYQSMKDLPGTKIDKANMIKLWKHEYGYDIIYNTENQIESDDFWDKLEECRHIFGYNRALKQLF
eukprot:110205_1